MRALVVEDEPEMAALLEGELSRQGFAVDSTPSLDAAAAALRLGAFALVLLDRRLADGDGLHLMREIRTRQANAAVIVLSALADAGDRVAGLDAGADDYLAKPFDSDELRARISAALRRTRNEQHALVLRCGHVSFEGETRSFAVHGVPTLLRRREAALLEALIRRARRVVPREVLTTEVYSFDDEPSSNTLDAHISRLRRRLQRLDAGVVIHPVRGVGYLLDEA
jgi:DNA-binding response OmpR family regulator